VLSQIVRPLARSAQTMAEENYGCLDWFSRKEDPDGNGAGVGDCNFEFLNGGSRTRFQGIVSQQWTDG